MVQKFGIYIIEYVDEEFGDILFSKEIYGNEGKNISCFYFFRG